MENNRELIKQQAETIDNLREENEFLHTTVNEKIQIIDALNDLISHYENLKKLQSINMALLRGSLSLHKWHKKR